MATTSGPKPLPTSSVRVTRAKTVPRVAELFTFLRMRIIAEVHSAPSRKQKMGTYFLFRRIYSYMMPHTYIYIHIFIDISYNVHSNSNYTHMDMYLYQKLQLDTHLHTSVSGYFGINHWATLTSGGLSSWDSWPVRLESELQMLGFDIWICSWWF